MAQINADRTARSPAEISVPATRARVRAAGRRARTAQVAHYAFVYALLVAIAILVLAPLEWVVASSFTTRETVWKNVLPFNWRAFLPEGFSLDGYRQIFEAGF